MLETEVTPAFTRSEKVAPLFLRYPPLPLRCFGLPLRALKRSEASGELRDLKAGRIYMDVLASQRRESDDAIAFCTRPSTRATSG